MTRPYADSRSKKISHARWPLIIVRGALGLALLACPRRLLPGGGSAPTGLVLTARVLGGRHLIEAGLLAPHIAAPPPRWAGSVDALHALSMLAMGRFAPRFRAPALASAGVASALAALARYERR